MLHDAQCCSSKLISRVEPQPQLPQLCLFVQSFSDNSKTVGIIECLANLVSLKHFKFEVIAGRSSMIHQRTTDALSVPCWSDEEASYLVAQQ